MLHVLDNLTDEIADVAVFYYAGSGLYHYAKVTWTDGYHFHIVESNFSHCEVTERTITLDYQHLIGFYRVR